MKKFRFRLLPLQKHRRVVEQERRVILAKALTKVRETESKLFQIDEQEVNARRGYEKLGSSFQDEYLSSNQFWVVGNFIWGQGVRRKNVKEDLESQSEGLKDCYNEFVKAHQERKVIDKIRENDFANFKKKMARNEKKEMDDLYTMRGNKWHKYFSKEDKENEE